MDPDYLPSDRSFSGSGLQRVSKSSAGLDMSALLFLSQRLSRYVDPLLDSHGHKSWNLINLSTLYAVRRRPQHFTIFQLPSADTHAEIDYDSLGVIP